MNCAACELNSRAIRTPYRAAISPTSRTLLAACRGSPRSLSTGLMTVAQPSDAAATQLRVKISSNCSRSGPLASIQPLPTPTAETARPLARTRSSICTSDCPLASARSKSRRRSSTASQPVMRATFRSPPSGVESSVQVWSASLLLTGSMSTFSFTDVALTGCISSPALRRWGQGNSIRGWRQGAVRVSPRSWNHRCRILAASMVRIAAARPNRRTSFKRDSDTATRRQPGLLRPTQTDRRIWRRVR